MLWSILAAFYLGFRLWYDGGGGPLSPQEVEHYVAVFEERGVEPARIEKLREFLASDTGSEFLMANFIHLTGAFVTLDALLQLALGKRSP